MSRKLPKNITWEPLIFPHYITPNGFLDQHRASHALFYYYLTAQSAYETYEQETIIVYEGDPDPVVDYLSLLKSIATMYGLEIGNLVQCWSQIDKQCDLLHLPRLPNNPVYRFNVVGSIDSINNIH